jgi:hypothetical protein
MTRLLRPTLAVALLGFLWATPTLAREKIKLMYLETAEEVRTAVLINRLEVPLEVHRVGIFRVGKNLYGVIRFGATGREGQPATRHQIGTTTAILSDRLFGEMPQLVRIDFEGVSFRETKEAKPEVFSSATIDRNSWRTIPKNLLPLERVMMAGTLYFDPRIEEGQPLGKKPTPAPKKPAKGGKTREKTPRSESR